MLALWYTATVFLSALLLFLVQPMFGKMVLPLLGGTPAVWTTCMLFFQIMLLGGYAYAHLLPAWIGTGRHIVLHLVLFVLSLAFLPLGVPEGWVPPAEANPVPSLVALLTFSLGVPFFLLSSTGPLVQHWFARTEHPSARNPYFLYSASNVGSMVALLAYPLLLEPSLSLRPQSALWAGGYALLGVMLAGATALAWRRLRAPEPAAGSAPTAPGIGWAGRLRWTALAFVPSSLLLGVTNYITTDVAAVPLLWVVPLALYLLTFAIVFATRPPIPHHEVLRSVPGLVVATVLIWYWVPLKGLLLLLPGHLILFFFLALLCHGDLAARRPPAARLTEYYLWIAFGGALGGVFNVIVAPRMFDSVAEYPLMLVAACMLGLAGAAGKRDARGAATGLAACLVMGLVLGLASWWVAAAEEAGASRSLAMDAVVVLGTSGAAALWYGLRGRPVWFGLALAVVVVARELAVPGPGEALYADRSFFGVHRVRTDEAGRHHVYLQGTTIHGAQRRAPEERHTPLTYFSEEGPLGDVFHLLRGRPGSKRVGVVGLGIGTMAAYAQPGEHWTYFEIDPMVERIARDERFFSFLRDSPARVDVVLGDGRLSLADAAEGEFDLIIIDAFSSDAIPVHLLTREAFALYRSRLAPGGVLALNLSNRYLDLRPTVRALAVDGGFDVRFRTQSVPRSRVAAMIFPSRWAALSPTAGALEVLPATADWVNGKPGWATAVWTDDFSNILAAIRR